MKRDLLQPKSSWQLIVNGDIENIYSCIRAGILNSELFGIMFEIQISPITYLHFQII